MTAALAKLAKAQVASLTETSLLRQKEFDPKLWVALIELVCRPYFNRLWLS
jgi:hypothetical protein